MGYRERRLEEPYARALGDVVPDAVPGSLVWVPPMVQIQGIVQPVSAPAPNAATYRVVPVPAGPDGTYRTLELMGELAREFAADPYSIMETRDVVRDCGSKDYLCEIQSILSFVKQTVTYREGSLALLQWLQSPGFTWHVEGQGACADMAAQVAGMTLVDGKRSAFRAVAVDPNTPDAYSHVYSRALVNGSWYALDAVGPGQVGWEPPESDQFLQPMDLEI